MTHDHSISTIGHVGLTGGSSLRLSISMAHILSNKSLLVKGFFGKK